MPSEASFVIGIVFGAVMMWAVAFNIWLDETAEEWVYQWDEV